MKILLVGSGGREHALAWKISQSPLSDEALRRARQRRHRRARRVRRHQTPTTSTACSTSPRSEAIDLTVVGPETPLCKGIVDLFQENGLQDLRPAPRRPPSSRAARSSARTCCAATASRRANYRVFTSRRAALQFVEVLAASPWSSRPTAWPRGKGVVICQTESEAIVAIEGMMEKKVFGKARRAGRRRGVHQRRRGLRPRLHRRAVDRPAATTAQDHKRVYDGDRGPNTGGMGAYCAGPGGRASATSARDPRGARADRPRHEQARSATSAASSTPASCSPKSGPKVLEFNVRFGDPECQPLLMTPEDRHRADHARHHRREARPTCSIESDTRPAVCVVMASGGYPGTYETGYEITGIDDGGGDRRQGLPRGHASRRTASSCTAGGRVLGVTAQGKDLREAQANAYVAVKKIALQGRPLPQRHRRQGPRTPAAPPPA